MASDDLEMVFVPPLATILAACEKQRGRPLTEPEVVAVRDRATVVATPRSAVVKLSATRGFRDVDPEDCWADWHRLRVEHTGNGCLPKIVLCVLGDAAFGRRAGALLVAKGVEHEVQARDARMGTSFGASEPRVDPSMRADDLQAIERHGCVVYVLSENFGAAAAPGAASSSLALGASLLEAGGVAMKCESSGIAHGRARWLELATDARPEGKDGWWALLRAYVQLPIDTGRDYYTCGLHLLGRPDLIASHQSVDANASECARLFHQFAMCLLVECPPKRFASGHTFRCDADTPRFVVRWEPCHGYDEDEFFFNPFGRYRFERS